MNRVGVELERNQRWTFADAFRYGGDGSVVTLELLERLQLGNLIIDGLEVIFREGKDFQLAALADLSRKLIQAIFNGEQLFEMT